MPSSSKTDTSQKPPSTIRVVAGVISHGDQVLACRRRAEKSEGGLWEFPGGKIEPGESPEEALARELKEELNISATIENRVIRATTQRGSVVIDLDVYRATVASGSITASTDHDVLRWLPIAALPSLTWAPADLPAITALIAAAESAPSNKQ